MTRPHRTRRFLAGFGLVLVVLAVGFAIANWLIPTWGSTPAEQAQVLPGDDLFTQPVLKWEHAITIHAAPEQIWPWLIQMGDTRAGYYSYRYIEKAITALAGVDTAAYYPNTNTVHPEWQSPAIGQGMLMDVLVLRDVQANQYLVAGPKPGQEQAGLLWAWALAPQPDGTTRLLVHMRIQIPGMGGNKWVGGALNLATFMMERKMMEGIKLHAEGGGEADWVQIAEAVLWLAALIIGLMAASRFITRPDWKLPLGIGLAAVLVLLGLVYLQPALWLRLALVLAMAGGLVAESRLNRAARGASAPAGQSS
jgi:hypothetical protein